MDERDEPLRRRGGGDNAGDYGYTVGQPPGYNAPPPSQQWARPPAALAKHKRTTPLWVTIVVGIAGLVIGTGIGSAGKSKTDTSATGTTSSTSSAGPAASTPEKPTTSTAAAAVAPADKSANGDVTLGKFTVDAIGAVTVPVTVINHSSKKSNYIIEFEVDDANGIKIGDGLASTNNIAPNQKAQISGVALGNGDGQPTTVKLTSVTRYAS